MGGTANQSTREAPLRLAGLDGLRGLAACAVAFGFHAKFLFAEGALPAGTGGFIGDWLRSSGWMAVDLFFVLSGFVFAHVYLGAGAPARGSWRSFVVARVARLYPLHLLTLLFCLLALSHLPGNTVLAFAGHLAMGQALVQPAGYTFNGPSWSITIEALCYALFAAGLWGGAALLRAITLAGLAAGLVGVAVYAHGAEVTTPAALARGLLGFFFGQALWRGRAHLARIPSPVLAGVLLGALCINPAPFSPVLPLTLLGWPAALLLALRLRVMTARPLLWLGDRSYAIYLIHMPLIDSVYHSTRGGLPGGSVTVLAAHVTLAVITLILADLSWRRVELPAREAIRLAWARHQARSGQAAAGA